MSRTALNILPISVGAGPYGLAHTVTITPAPIVSVACDAYAVFHPADAVSTYGVAGSIARFGGMAGMRTYGDSLKARTTPQRSGELFVTPSGFASPVGSGQAEQLFHMVGGFPKLLPDREDEVRDMFSYLMREANHRKVSSLAIPPIGLHRGGKSLTPNVSAAILLGAIYDYWKANPMSGPHSVIVPMNGNKVLANSYREALERIFGDGSEQAIPDADEFEMQPMPDDEAMMQAIADLGDPERSQGSLRFLRSVSTENPAAISSKLMAELARIAEEAPALNTNRGTIMGRGSIPNDFQAISILNNVAQSGKPSAKTASRHLAQIGFNRKSARRHG